MSSCCSGHRDVGRDKSINNCTEYCAIVACSRCSTNQTRGREFLHQWEWCWSVSGVLDPGLGAVLRELQTMHCPSRAPGTKVATGGRMWLQYCMYRKSVQ